MERWIVLAMHAQCDFHNDALIISTIGLTLMYWLDPIELIQVENPLPRFRIASVMSVRNCKLKCLAASGRTKNLLALIV
jgi:hypothetical protein